MKKVMMVGLLALATLNVYAKTPASHKKMTAPVEAVEVAPTPVVDATPAVWPCGRVDCATPAEAAQPAVEAVTAPASTVVPAAPTVAPTDAPVVATEHSKFAIGLIGGTLGAGVQGVFKINERLNVRGLLTGFSMSKTVTDSSDSVVGTDSTYDGKIGLSGVGLLADYYPFKKVLRLSTGLIYNGTKIDVTGVPNVGNTYEYNGHTYTGAEVGTVKGGVKYGKMMPYLGIGFGNMMAGSRFSLGLDVGVLFGKASSSLTADGQAAQLNPQLQTDLQVERQKLQDNVNKLPVWPVINLGMSYRF